MQTAYVQQQDVPRRMTGSSATCPHGYRLPTRYAGFTLVEILIVVMILGILAAIVVPQFTSAAGESRENSLKMNLYRIRQQIEIYKQHHGGNYPSVEHFTEQMTQATNLHGNFAEPGTVGYPFGPYLRDIPINPMTSSRTVGDGAVGSSDWYFNENTGEFRANNHEDYVNF